jgi:regulator of protease activity HflC (stomatin/prohibitin superfamily)
MGNSGFVLLCMLVGCVLLYALLMAMAVRIVPKTQRLVIFRLGRYLGVRGPGLVFVIPAIDTAIKAELLEQQRTVLCEDILTRDHELVTVEADWQYKIPDPAAVVLPAGSFEKIAQDQFGKSLREVIGGLLTREVLAGREIIAEEVCRRLNTPGLTWGGWAMKIDVRGITPRPVAPEAVQGRFTSQSSLLGSVGEAKSPVYSEGTIELSGENWHASSQRPIAPGKKVRVKGVVLEVEEV